MDGYEGEEGWEFGDPTWEPVDWREFRHDLGWACVFVLLFVVVGLVLLGWVVTA